MSNHNYHLYCDNCNKVTIHDEGMFAPMCRFCNLEFNLITGLNKVKLAIRNKYNRDTQELLFAAQAVGIIDAALARMEVNNDTR